MGSKPSGCRITCLTQSCTELRSQSLSFPREPPLGTAVCWGQAVRLGHASLYSWHAEAAAERISSRAPKYRMLVVRTLDVESNPSLWSVPCFASTPPVGHLAKVWIAWPVHLAIWLLLRQGLADIFFMSGARGLKCQASCQAYQAYPEPTEPEQGPKICTALSLTHEPQASKLRLVAKKVLALLTRPRTCVGIGNPRVSELLEEGQARRMVEPVLSPKI